MMEDDIQILEPKEYTPDKKEVYSHSSLLMSALKKVRESRAKEMRDGYWNTKFDRLGNAHLVWVPDSRMEFIESVEALIMIQQRDFDEGVIKNINKIQEELKKQFEKYCEEEKKEWESMSFELKQKYNRDGHRYREGKLSDGLIYRYEYIRDKVEAYSKIVSEIQDSIKRIGEYQEELYEA